MRNVYVFSSPESSTITIQGKTKTVKIDESDVGYSHDQKGLKAIIMPSGTRHYLDDDCRKIQY